MGKHYGRNDGRSHTPPTWYKVNSEISDQASKWSQRNDITASIIVEKDRKGSPPAYFDPERHEITINAAVAFGEVKPEHIGRMTDRSVQFEFAKASGAILHESLHARFTTWLVDAANRLTPEVREAVHTLEESRIERLGVVYYPENRPFLRSCALSIVMADVAEDLGKLTKVRAAAQLAAYTLARVDAGVLEESDVADIRVAVTGVLGVDLLADLQEVWLKAQSVEKVYGNTSPELYGYGQEWVDLLNKASASDDKADQEQQAAQDAFQEMIMQMLGDSAASAEINAQEDIFDQQSVERRQAKEREKELKANEKALAKNAAKQVFNRPEPKGRSYGQSLYGMGRRETESHVTERRAPLPEERNAAIQVGRELEKAKYHDRIRIESTGAIPPGRLRGGAAVQGAAYKALGMHLPTEPWRRVQRKHEIDPNLSVGIMVDCSGSMGGAMRAMGVTAWVMAEAVNRIQGKAAMVYFGYSVFPTLKVGQKLDEITVFSADDGRESFDEGFQALDGALDLLSGSGARLLVVVSDGAYKDVEVPACTRWLKRCNEEGVAVLWIGYGRSSYAEQQCAQTGATFVLPANTPTETAILVGKAAADALTAIGSRIA